MDFFQLEKLTQKEIIPGCKSRLIHSGKAIAVCKTIDVFHPVREDYKV